MLNSKKMIIEFYGLPGSGKTTTARQLVSSSGFEKVKIKNIKEITFFNLLFLFKHPVKFFVLLYFIISNSNSMSMFYSKFINAFLVRNAKYEKALRYKNAIIDEGHFQNILSVFEKPITEKSLMKYLRFTLYPDFLIIFDINKEELAKRIEKRGYISREDLGTKYLEGWKKVTAKNHELLLSSKDRLDVRYLVYSRDNIGDILNMVSA